MTTLETLLKQVEELDAKAYSQSNESLLALANDLGQITNPNLAIAASVATELLCHRRAAPILVEVIRKLVEQRDYEIESAHSVLAHGDMKEELNAELDAIVAKGLGSVSDSCCSNNCYLGNEADLKGEE